jgi:hypothetical protein
VTLQAAGASVVCYDPEGENSARLLLPGVIFASSAYAFLQGGSALPVLTEWDEFHALDPARNRATPAKPVVVDLRDIYPNETMRSLCFRYVGSAEGLRLRVGTKGGLSSGCFARSVWTLRARSSAKQRRTNADRDIRAGLCGSDRSDLPR